MRERIKSILKLAVIAGLELWGLSVAAQPASIPSVPAFFARRDYPGLFGEGVQVADTNADGVPDVIVNQVGGVQALLGNGDGTFRSGPSSQPVPGEQPYAVTFAATDLNGDGKVDLALVMETGGGGIVVSLGNGDGTFPDGTVYPISDNLVFLVVGDFNGDGIPDIATAGNSGVWLLTGKGGGAFNSPVLAVSLAGGYNIAAADFNQDGKLDLVVTLPYASRTGGGFAVLLGNGDGSFQSPMIFATPPCRLRSRSAA
jgi:hypothetical protein